MTPKRDHLSVILIVLATILAGFLNLSSTLLPAEPANIARLNGIVPFSIRHGARLLTIMSGFGLMVLAQALGRRKQRAWLAACLLLAISIGLHLIKGLDIDEATVDLGLLALLLWARREFAVESDAASLKLGLQQTILLITVAVVFGLVGYRLLDYIHLLPFNWLNTLQKVLKLLLGINPAPGQPLPRDIRWFQDSVSLIGLLTWFSGIFLLLRPVLLASSGSNQERAQVAELLAVYGQLPLQQLALLSDKRYFFGPEGGSAIAYRLIGCYAIALTDPIGPPAILPELVSSFSRQMRRLDYEPVFFQISDHSLNACRAAGLHTMRLGQEAVVDTAKLDLSQPGYKSLRNSTARLERLGYRCHFVADCATPLLLRALKTISDEWLASQHGSEKSFSLGRFDYDYLADKPLLWVSDISDDPIAFLTFVPYPNNRGFMLDLMRKSRQAPSGVMEFAISEAIHALRQQHVPYLNLGLVAFAGLDESERLTERAGRLIYHRFRHFYDFQGLYRFKQKFQPVWQDRYLAYSSPLRLPNILLAIIRANSGGSLKGYVTKKML